MKLYLALPMAVLAAGFVRAAPSLEEGFEATTFPPPGWTTQTAGLPLPHAWHRTTDPAYRGSGKGSAYVGSDAPAPIDEWLITPVVVLASRDSTLMFSWSGNEHWSDALDASVNIREAGTTHWTTLWSLAGHESPADPFVYRPRFVDISGWIGKRVQFGFRVTGSRGASFGLDDVAIGDFAPAGSHPPGDDTLCAAASGGNPWRVTALREPWADDVPLETRNRYLQSPPGNYAPGPDSLVARVVIVERRGHVEIEDLRTGSSRRLLDSTAFLPNWSPDGALISCLVWSREFYAGKLVVVDIATDTIVLENGLTQASSSKWSPDSRTIAVSGIAYQNWHGAFLYTISVPGGTVSVIDSLDLLASHEFSWSPDGRWIAFSRPTELHHYGDTIAAGLWIAEVATGQSWCVLDAPEWAERDPLWITNRSLQITRVQWNDEGDNPTQRLIVELSHAADARR